MKKMIALTILGLLWNVSVIAAGLQYEMRVDGLACPYCVYGIEKKLNAIDGVEKIEVDLDKGLVTVIVSDGVRLTEAQMTNLFLDAGFTFRSMTEKTL